MAVYERMLADGMQPTTGTYTGLITAWGKNGKVSCSQVSTSSSFREPFTLATLTFKNLAHGRNVLQPTLTVAPSLAAGRS